MKNCPNCGSPIEPYKCKCEYCGTWYFDFTTFDMSKDEPYYVKFRTPYGVVTTLARPELQTIDMNNDVCYATDRHGNALVPVVMNRQCDLNVVFHSVKNIENDTLFTLEAYEE